MSVGHHRLLWMDSLRGAAAAAVVVGHYVWGHIDPAGTLPFDPAEFGVAVFFLISGNIVPRLVKTGEPGCIGLFVVNRAFRLLPVYWVSVIFAALVYGTGLGQTFGNLVVMQRYIGIDNIIGAVWTLQVEVLFYGWVVLAIFFDRLHHCRFVALTTAVGIALALCFGAIRFYANRKAPVAVPVGFITIMAGYWISLAQTNPAARKTAMQALAAITISLPIVFVLSYSKDWGFHEHPWRFIGSNGLAATIFWWACRGQSFQVRPLIWIAWFSYPLYLIHQAMQTVGERLAAPNSDGYGELIAFVIVVPAALLVSWAIERPSIHLGRRVSSWFTHSRRRGVLLKPSAASKSV